MSALRTGILTSISDIDPTVWNSVVSRNHLICRHEYLQAIERSSINDCRYYYPVVYDDDRVVAHTCLYFISTELDLFAKGIGKLLVNGIRHLWRRFMILRSIECGTPVALGTTISVHKDTDRQAVLSEIVRATEQVAREQGVPVILFRDFSDGELGFYDALVERGYSRIRNLPAAHMQIKWRSFDGYINSMSSRYRHKHLSQQKRFTASGATIEVIDNFSSIASDLARLWRNVYDRATEYRREILLADFFENLDTHLARVSYLQESVSRKCLRVKPLRSRETMP